MIVSLTQFGSASILWNICVYPRLLCCGDGVGMWPPLVCGVRLAGGWPFVDSWNTTLMCGDCQTFVQRYLLAGVMAGAVMTWFWGLSNWTQANIGSRMVGEWLACVRRWTVRKCTHWGSAANVWQSAAIVRRFFWLEPSRGSAIFGKCSENVYTLCTLT
jgi:hypothetical protein